MNEAIRNRIEEQLKTRHMMQREFIDRLGVSEVTASRWLNRERNPTMEIFHKNGKHSRNSPHVLLYKRCCRGNTTGRIQAGATGKERRHEHKSQSDIRRDSRTRDCSGHPLKDRETGLLRS